MAAKLRVANLMVTRSKVFCAVVYTHSGHKIKYRQVIGCEQ